MKQIEITEQQAQQMYDSGIEALKSIAETNYPELFKKEIKWENFGNIKGYYIDSESDIIKHLSDFTDYANKNIFPSKKEAEACLALSQLCQWRDKRNEN